MKTSLSGIAALAAGFAPELYTFTFKDDSQWFATTHNSALAYRSQTYAADTLIIQRGVISQKIGMDVGTCELTLSQPVGKTIGGLSLSEFVSNGGFNGARIKIERARTDRVCWLFDGLVSEAAPDGGVVKLVVSDPKVLLNVKMPRNTINPYCGWALFGSGCGLNKESFAVSGSVNSGSSGRVINCGLTNSDNYFDLGTVTFTSGANAGATRSVRDYVVGQFVLSKAFDHAPAVGDTFVAYPGDNKSRSTCKDIFNNEANIRVFPYVPVPQASV